MATLGKIWAKMLVMSIKKDITAKAHSVGFDAVGFSVAADFPDAAGVELKRFLENGWHGDMTWLETKADRRQTPLALWGDVKGIIVLAQNYGGKDDVLGNLGKRDVGNISVYARGRDYHDLVKKRLKRLGGWVHDTFNTPVKVFVDTAPVMEKPLAQLAGLGWQGKHTNLVSTDYGSWLFLGAVFTALEWRASKTHADRCGTCRECLDICPTDAFPAPYKLDARRCISYLTIEHKGPIPMEFRKAIGNRIYGCDDCLAVCPWNKYAKTSHDLEYFARHDLSSPKIVDLLDLDDATFRALFSKSPIKRTGRERFLRNVLIAAGNSGDKKLKAKVKSLLDDPSPLIRGSAAWAYKQLAKEEEIITATQRGLKDTDKTVRAEWK